MIQGDISKCFDKIPYEIIMKLIERKVKCSKTLHLIIKTLKAGYIDPETNKLVVPDQGTPQGSVLSPLLSNIVLHELDEYMTKLENEFHLGKSRARNREYDKIQARIQRLTTKKEGDYRAEVRQLIKARRRLKSSDPMDPNFKRLMYLRYADDFVVLVVGSREDALRIRTQVKRQL